MQNKEYKENTSLSQSAIKDFKKMPPLEWKKLWIDKTKEHKDTESTIFGSLVDSLLFCPKKVEERFITCEVKKPSDSIAFIIDKVADLAIADINNGGDKDLLKEYHPAIVEYAKYVTMADGSKGYGQKWSKETLISKVVKEGEAYFDFLKTTNGKTVVSAGDYMDALLVAEKVKNYPLTAKYFDPANNIFQLEIFSDGLKGALDILHISKEAEYLKVVDFKTAESAFFFQNNIWKFGYLEQIATYDKLARAWKAEHKEYKDFVFDSPINIVIDRQHKIPYIYEYNWEDIKNVWNGYNKNGVYIKGIKGIIEDIKWHIKEDKWEYPQTHYTYGRIPLELINADYDEE